ncbi:cobalamin biosynthesis protein [Roseobacteraceae bacterium S113]
MECGVVIVAGFGFRGAAQASSLNDALRRAGANHAVAALAAPADKAATATFRDFASRQGLPVIALDPETLAAQDTPTQSQASRDARNTGSVAEAAALVGAGAGAVLLAPRVISDDRLATCALAKGTPS